ncbi:MAG: DUF6263 family protein [Phycisphaerae bacterium]|nr:DUF6263 family protein [Phycisphaerae bacterium]
MLRTAKKTIVFCLLFSVFCLLFCGCQEGQKSDSRGSGSNLLLSVDFKPDSSLAYKIVSERQISLDLDPSGKGSRGGKNSDSVQNITEKLEMGMVYKPVKIDPYGYSEIQARCVDARVRRSSGRLGGQNKKDAVEFVVDKTFTLKITPTGKVVDYSSLEMLIKELGEKSFSNAANTRVKDPDMIMDFIATQWNIWESVASIKNPAKGIKKGQKWNSKLLAPMPFVAKIGRDVEYRLKDFNGSTAELVSSYKLSSSPPDTPMPYTGSFQMRGTFGFLRGYQVLSIEGDGSQIFDVEKGLIKTDTQRYQAKVKASIFGLGSDSIEPNIIINQTITMTLAE